ncbi:ATP-binding protein [Stigmatella sp. ncwal1]|uniref:histidine kinase n=1 Tax=Stigmatella ashevillensis TaxID=2995309 RepID=A0ABT5DNY1_9BACT|nr:ATP-binding protein [Stigmatella ashevillena]MDC0714076.1 ATP-binding protein [Stigmatella ashevillena]
MIRVRVDQVAAAFGLLVGITMVYVPYEFGARVFQPIYPSIRLLGSAFLVGSAMMIAAMLYSDWPAWFGWLGRALFLAPLTIYWWTSSVIFRGLTGGILYPLMAACLILESLPRWRDRSLLPGFLTAVALSFGVLMLFGPPQASPTLSAGLKPVALPVALLFLGSGVLLAVGRVRRQQALDRLAVGVLCVLFATLAVILAAASSWTGMELYTVVSLACLLLAFLKRLPQPSGVRWRLFRGMAFASVLPIIAVGALASVLAQKAIERELRGKAQQAVLAEAAWLEQSASIARALVSLQVQDPSLQEWARAREQAALRKRFELLEQSSGQFDEVWMLDGQGDVVQSSPRTGPVQGNFSHRDYFQGAKASSQVYLSQPFRNASGFPVVVFSSQVPPGSPNPSVFVGGVSLLRLGHQSTLASRSYHVEIFDRRDGRLLRETERGGVLTRAPILSFVKEDALSMSEGILETFDASGQRLLIAHAQVPDTPWVVVVVSHLRQAFAPVTRLSAIVVAVALLAGAISLLLSQWVGRDVAQRLEALRDGFAALKTLSLEKPIPTQGDDEVAQLTASFNEMAARIEQTQKELREAITIRDQFLSMASHELRTPLTPLKATLELLLRQASENQVLPLERQRATLERLRRQVDRITRLVSDMLDVARLQGGRLSMKRASMDLTALAREVADRIQHSSRERSAPIQLELPESRLVGVWDEQRLDQLLTNLIENAARYSPPDTPIQVRIGAEASRVHIDVEDRGIGVPAESLSSLFTPYYRARNAAQHYAGGLGLGLAICREIVERHGGTIQATSAGLGQGTRFSVSLPIDSQDTP